MFCPICKQTVSWQDNSFRPFCSERCKLIDLNNWLKERYRVPAAPAGLDTADESSTTDLNTNTEGERD